MISAPAKHPDSDKWYYLQWSDKELEGAVITSSSWIVPAELVKNQQITSGLTVGIRLSGGLLDHDYSVINKITTSNNEAIQVTLNIRVRESGH